MTMTRVSMVLAAEGYRKGTNIPNFGRGRGYYKRSDVQCSWIHAPTGTFIGSDHNRQAAPIRAMGTKLWDTVQYGAFTGAFNWTFTLDYEYLHALTFLFEGYKETTRDDGTITYTFEKLDYSRIKSFTVIRTILNGMTGGGDDEVEQFFGCIAKNFTISRSAGTSTISVTITGFYVAERMFLGELTKTDYEDNTGQLAEYMCMFVSDKLETDPSNMHYVANTESVSIGIDNNSERIYNTCSPFAGAYFEGMTDYKFSTTCYSNDPANYKQRLYGGGEIVKLESGSKVIIPKSKKLHPLKQITLLTHDKESMTGDDFNTITQEEYVRAYLDADRKMAIDVYDTVIKSLNWSKSEGQKLTDSLSNAECKVVKMYFQALSGHDMGSFDLCEDPKKAPDVKHKCPTPIVNSEGGMEW